MVEELKRLSEYYEKETGQPLNMLGLALSARKNLCIHPEVSQHRNDGKVVDIRCRTLTASFVRDEHKRNETVPVCDFFEVRLIKLVISSFSHLSDFSFILGIRCSWKAGNNACWYLQLGQLSVFFLLIDWFFWLFHADFDMNFALNRCFSSPHIKVQYNHATLDC